MKPPDYVDLHALSEDKRIEQIGIAAMVHGKVCGAIVDAKPTATAERYMTKLRLRYPGIVIHSHGPGPVPDTILIKVGPPA